MSLNKDVRDLPQYKAIEHHISTKGFSQPFAKIRVQDGQLLNAYPNQEMVSLLIVETMKRAYTSSPKCSSNVIVLAHPQSGKTTCETRSIDSVDELCKTGFFQHDVGRYHHVGKPLRTLIKQSQDRLPAGVQVVIAQDITWKVQFRTNRGNEVIKHVQRDLTAGKEVVVHDDEVHLNKGDMGSFNSFLKDHLKIKAYAAPPSMWSVDNCHIVGYSASPFGHLMHAYHQLKKGKDSAFTFIYMQPGKGYVKMKDIMDSGRIIDVSQKIVIVKKSKKKRVKPQLSADFTRACNDFLNAPGAGRFIVRVKAHKDESYTEIKRFFDAHGIDVTWAVASTPGSIEKLKHDLECAPQRKEVWLIKRAFGAGDTLCQDHIQAVWEGHSGPNHHLDARLQELGRWCGYNVNHKMKIYVSHETVLRIVKFWSDIEDRLHYNDGAEELDADVIKSIGPTLPSGVANRDAKSAINPKLHKKSVFG